MPALPPSNPLASLFPPARAGLRPAGGRERRAGRTLAVLLLAAMLVGLAAGPLAAQQVTPVAAGHGADEGEGTGPIVLVPTEPKAKPLKVSALAVEARVLGLRAETQLTLTFYNPAPRSIAGDLYLPLPEGATVSGYSLDVAGSLVDGVVVEKRHGREAFETEMRKGVDPGLVEWARGHTFKTRVFPIPAHGSRTVRVRYVSPLEERGQGHDRELTYRLPLRVEGRVDTATVRVEVVRPGRAPQVRAGGLPGLDFGRWRDGWVAKTSLKDATLQGDLVIALPENPLANPDQPSVRVEVAPDGQAYFVIDDRPPPAHVAPPPPPRAIALYWDASASRRATDAQRAVALLRAYFAHRADVPARVTLVVFRDVPEAARTFDLPAKDGKRAEDLEALLAACAQAVRDGATRLDALPPPPPGSDAVFLVSDGLATLGRGAFPHTAVPVYAFGGGAGGDHAALRALARHSGGAYFNLARLDDAAVLDGLGGPRYRFLGAEFDKGTVTEGYPDKGAPVGARFAYAARLTGQEARVTLLYGVGGKVLHHRTVAVSRAEATRGDLLRVTWAQAKLAELLLEPGRYASAITALGRAQSLVTPGTSLIVLERPEQYAAYNIEPPASRPAWRARYAELIARRERETHAKQADRLAYLRKLWRERVAWWNTRFEYPPDFRYEPPPREKPRPSGGLFERLQEQADAARREAPPPGETPALARQAAPGTSTERERKAKGVTQGRGEATVVVRAWDPDTPYLAELKAAKPAAAYATYLSQREIHGAAPAFYLDVGDFFAARDEEVLAERIWSNLAEMELENPALLRVLAHRLDQAHRLQTARLVFEEVLRLRPEEPQSHRDLALVLARLGHYRRAVALLGEVVMGNWDARFPEVELIALEELNRIWPQARAAGVDELPIHPSLVALLDVDLRVVLTWDADQADMDLWVTEPSGEQAYYRHRKTTIGGLVSHDLTAGYGPEEYLVHRAMPGTYTVAVKYYANRAPSLTGSVTLQVEIFTHYGRKNEERRAVTVRLRKSKEMLNVAEVSF